MARKTVTVTLYMSEIIYDVENKTYLTGRARENGQNFEVTADMKANEDPENRNQIIRTVGNAYRTLKTKISEYLNEESLSSSNAQIPDNENLVFTLKMPSNFNEAATDGIASICHQYIVNLSVAEWFTIFDKNDANDYWNLAANNLTQLREALSRRVRPVRSDV